jgi:hypothetical protein
MYLMENTREPALLFMKCIGGWLSPDLELYIASNDPAILEKYFPADRVRFLKFRSRSSVIRLAFELPFLIRKHRIQYAHFQYMVPRSGIAGSLLHA